MHGETKCLVVYTPDSLSAQLQASLAHDSPIATFFANEQGKEAFSGYHVH